MRRENQNVNFDVPVEYCGQGVGVSSHVVIAATGKAYVLGTINDGNGNSIGSFELADDRTKLYVNFRDTSGLKHETIVNVLEKIRSNVEFALTDILEAEDDGQQAEAATSEDSAPAEE